MATKARSPTRRVPPASPPSGRREASPQQLAERVKELEEAEKEAKKTQVKEQKQRQRELAEAKKKIAKELQAASRIVQKGEREANRLTTKADQVEKQASDAKAKAARAQAQAEEGLGRMQAKKHVIETSLQEKMSVIGEAKGRLAHAAFAAKMLEAGVIVPVDGECQVDDAGCQDIGEKAERFAEDEYAAAPDGALRFDLEAAEVLAMADVSDTPPEADDEEAVAWLFTDNQRLRMTLQEALAEIVRLRREAALAASRAMRAAADAAKAAAEVAAVKAEVEARGDPHEQEIVEMPAAHVQHVTAIPFGARFAAGVVPAGAMPIQRRTISGFGVGKPVLGGSVSLPFARGPPAPSAGPTASIRTLSPVGRLAPAPAPAAGPGGLAGAAGAIRRVFLAPPSGAAGGGASATVAAAPAGAMRAASPVAASPRAVFRQTSGPSWTHTVAAKPAAVAPAAAAQTTAPVTATASTVSPTPRSPQEELTTPATPAMEARAEVAGPAFAPPLLMNMRNFAVAPAKPTGKPTEPLAVQPKLVPVHVEPIVSGAPGPIVYEPPAAEATQAV